MINPANTHEIKYQDFLVKCGFPQTLKDNSTFLLATRAAYIAGAGTIITQIAERKGPTEVMADLHEFMEDVSADEDATAP